MSKLSPNTAHLAWTATLLAGFPLFAWQAYRLRRDTPRLPEAPGPDRGHIDGDAPALRLAVLGESTVAGVGVDSHAEGLAGQCALQLAAKTGRAVDWLACGRNGATARAVRYQQVPLIATDTDVVVLGIGVNDVLSGCAPETWRQGLMRLLTSIRRRAPRATVLLSAVPPMGHFPAIPQPLRSMLGFRARSFDHIAQIVAAACPRALYLPIPFEGGKAFFCSDRFHPSPLAYRHWGQLVAQAVSVRLDESAAGGDRRPKRGGEPGEQS